MKYTQEVPRVGVGVFIFRGGKILMQKRAGSHGEGCWSVPGGHLEFAESFAETAKREVLEETGLRIKNVRFGAITNDHFKSDKKHYVTIWMLSDYLGGKNSIKEPSKCTDQGWFDFDNLPTPLFFPWKQLLKSEFVVNIREQAK